LHVDLVEDAQGRSCRSGTRSEKCLEMLIY